MTYIDIKNKITAGDFDSLVGLVEDEHLEVKSGKYDFSREGGKQEFAKDVSSFANRSGGIIVIGPKTSDNPAFFGRRIEALNLVPFDLINPTDYHNIIKDWIYPRPDNIEIDWASSRQDSDKGLFYIYIPNQPENMHPFLIKKDIDPITNRKRKEIMFGYIERISHTSDPVNVQTLHTMLRLGKENRWKEELNTRLSAIEAKLPPAPEESERQKHLEEIISSRITNAINASGLTNYRTYCLATTPLEKTEVRTLLNSSTDSIGKLMEEPPQLRHNGWKLFTGDQSKLINSQLRRVKNDEYLIMDLYRDGTLIFACRADQAFLGLHFSNMQINPIALIEITYLYFNFYSYVLKELTEPVRKIEIWTLFNNLHQNGQVTSLAPYNLDADEQRMQRYRHPAPDTNYFSQFWIDYNSFQADTLSFQILREIYAWFQIEEDKIPYLTNNMDSVDIHKISI